MSNIFQLPAEGIAAKEWNTVLARFQLANCQCTLTDNGFRIYRPPNYTLSNNGNTIYGGLKIVNSLNDTIHEYDSSIDNMLGLIEGHTYIIYFHIKGQNTTTPQFFSWTNNFGWDGNTTGNKLYPDPSSVIYLNIPNNFNGEQDCFYKFTITDTIVKTCASAYSSYILGENYLSYRHFKFGFNYTDTGSLGTDLYITNLCMYDITDNKKISVNKQGQIIVPEFIELNQSTSMRVGNVVSNEFYEY